MSCKLDCKYRYCGMIECACSKNEIFGSTSKNGIIPCSPGYSNEGIHIMGQAQGRNNKIPLYVRKCERLVLQNKGDCCLGNVDDYQGCPTKYCPGSEECHLYLKAFCSNVTPKYRTMCRDWVYKQDPETQIEVFNRICEKPFNYSQPECKAYFNRKFRDRIEFFQTPNISSPILILILILIFVLIPGQILA